MTSILGIRKGYSMDKYFYYVGYMKFGRIMENLDYVCDKEVTITHKDTEFVETRDVVSGGNRSAVILTVPSGNVVLTCLGSDSGYRYSLLGCNRLDAVSVVKRDPVTPDLTIWTGYCFEATSFPASIRLTKGQSLAWQIAEPGDIKRNVISYCGLWDIYVHRDEKTKFDWWKDGKYVPPTERSK